MGCSHNCDSCASGCNDPKSFLKPPHELSTIRKIIGVVSGKGGVGKSLVTSMLAVGLARRGAHTAILDADITGPSIPRAFGVTDKLLAGEQGVEPVKSPQLGIDIVSINLALEDENDPVIYRGPILAQTVQQFWQDVIWQDVDYMFVDMPPGTGDVPLTVFQSLPLDGVIVMTSPQGLVGHVVGKAIRMAQMMNVPIVGVIENYSYFTCPDCKTRIPVFGKSHVGEIVKEYGVPLLAQLPLNPALAAAVDAGAIEDALLPEALDDALDAVQALLEGDEA